VTPGQGNPPRILAESGGSRGESQHDLVTPRPPRKSSLSLMQKCPYRSPTLVGWDESPKVIETIFVKEFGILAP
jgi:hypothetical protein